MVSRTDILALQRKAGNRAVARMLAVAQPKLTVGPASDRFEQEADRVADSVMRNLPTSVAAVANESDEDLVGRAVMERVSRIEEPTTPIGLGGGDMGRATEARVRQARSGGAKLPPPVRRSMEQAMGADFGGVRVHAGTQADALSRSVQARAFTVGRDIFFARSQFRPGTADGQRLIAHELTHTLQQGAARLHRNITHRPGDPVVQRDVMDAVSDLRGDEHELGCQGYAEPLGR